MTRPLNTNVGAIGAALALSIASTPAIAQCIYQPGTFTERSSFVVLGVVTDVTETGNWADLERRYTVRVVQTTKGPAPDSFTFSIVYPAEPPLHDCGDPPPPRLWPRQEAFFYMSGSAVEPYPIRIVRVLEPVTR